MSRLACVDIPAFPLQLLLKEHPDWRSLPAVVVAEEKPQAFILWVNEKARRLGIRPGHRYAAGLALSRELRAGAIGEAHIYKEVEAITERLRRFTPDVEPAGASWHSPGLFWLNASGLGHLFPSLESWGENIRTALDKMGFFTSVAIGFSRFGTYAIARALRGLHVFESARDEDRTAQRVALSRLDIPPDAQASFIKLRIQTVADFLRLPPKGLLKRFGPEVEALHRLAAGDLFAPLAPEPPKEPLAKAMELPGPVADSERLLFFVKQLLDTLLQDLEAKSLALTKLFLRLELDDRRSLEEVLRPDTPTLDSPLLLGLVRLRLETLRLDAGAVELCLRAEAVRKTVEQLLLAARKPKREPRKQSRAFARLRAEFGDEAVVQAELLKGHLPSARFQWTPLDSLPTLSSPVEGQRTLIRRMRTAPYALPHRPRHEEDGWQLRGRDDACVDQLQGPFVLSGGWWRVEQHRTYYFAHTRKDEWLWVFRDTQRRRWYLHGRVE